MRAINIEPRMVERVEKKTAIAGVANIEARVAAAYDLPFDDQSFAVITMITALGEIPEPGRALAECNRVLQPEGALAISELLLDPDSIQPSTFMVNQHFHLTGAYKSRLPGAEEFIYGQRGPAPRASGSQQSPGPRGLARHSPGLPP